MTTGERRGDAPSAARTTTTGRAATVLVLGAVNAFTRCVRARRAVKPAGAQARARNVVVDACIVVAPSTVTVVKVQPNRMEPSVLSALFPCVDPPAGCSILCHDSETTRTVDTNSACTFGKVFGNQKDESLDRFIV